jgi:hypothetical protein
LPAIGPMMATWMTMAQGVRPVSSGQSQSSDRTDTHDNQRPRSSCHLGTVCGPAVLERLRSPSWPCCVVLGQHTVWLKRSLAQRVG